MERSVGNPYDFRSPVRRRDLLAGRGNELIQIDEYLRSAAMGRPIHFSLFGPAGSGKSSLLNGAVEVARERGLLPVKVELREATVETELEFYRVVIESALQALIDVGAIEANGLLMRSWALQTRAGSLDVTGEDQPLEIGLVLASKVNGGMVNTVPAPALGRDLSRIVELGAEHSIRGVVLCIDAAEHLDNNRDLAPGLIELTNSTSELTLVTAAEKSGNLQSAAPRAWAQVEVNPLKSVSSVLDAITRPLEYAEERDLVPTPETALDIYALTSGQPYEVTLVCHFIWEAFRQGKQQSFELSPAVIEQVLNELEEKGRHESSPDIKRLSSLTTSEYEAAVRIAPYEDLTIKDIALLRLMPSDYDEEDLARREAEVLEDLQRLEERGVLSLERDRFELAGGRDARLYLKYAARHRTDEEIIYRDSYVRQATFLCGELLRERLIGSDDGEALLHASGRPYEVGGLQAGRRIHECCDAVLEKDIKKLADLLAMNLDLEDLAKREDQGAILLGLVLQAGLHEAEQIQVLVDAAGLSIDQVRESVDEWISENTELLAKYNVRILEYRCELMSSDLLRPTAAYTQLNLYCALSFGMYQAGLISEADSDLSDCVTQASALLGDEPTDPLVRSELADALSRLGYIAATQGDWDRALQLMDQSSGINPEESWILNYNRAYVKARTGDFDAAAEEAGIASANVENHDGETVLLAAMPTPEDWEAPDPNWNVVELRGNWLEPFVGLQALVLAAQVDDEKMPDLARELDGVSPSAPTPLLRLAGWACLTLRGDKERAAELFDMAVAVSKLADVECLRAEAEYAHQAAEGKADQQVG